MLCGFVGILRVWGREKFGFGCLDLCFKRIKGMYKRRFVGFWSER